MEGDYLLQVTTICGELKQHTAVHARVKKAIADHDFSLIVVFPTLSMLRMIEDELLNLPEMKGLGGIRFLLFEGFIGEIRDLFGLNNRQATAMERNLIIQQICQELEAGGTLAYLNRVPFTQNYRQSLLDSIAEWKRSGLTVEVFRDWAQEKGIKEAELALIYQYYQERLVRHNLVEEDLTLEALHTLRLNGYFPEKKSRVILYGFTDLTPLQADYLKVLENWFEFEIIIDPTTVPEFQTFVASHFGFKTVAETVPDDLQPLSALQMLQNVFWRQEPEQLDLKRDDQSIKIIEVAGLNRQISSIAREISLFLHNNPAVTLADFLILTPQPHLFITQGRPIFARYGLELSAVTKTLQESTLVLEYLNLLKLLDNGWQWQDLQYLIRQLCVGPEATGADLLLLEIGKQYGALSGKQRWLHLIEEAELFEETNIAAVAFEKLKWLVKWLAEFPIEASLLELLTLTRQWFENRCQTILRSLNKQNKLIFGEQLWNCQAINCLITAIDELLGKDRGLWNPGQQLTLEEFQTFFTEFFLELEVKGVHSPKNGIRVLPPREARGLQAKVVFITGLEQGVFPRQYISDWKLDTDARFELKLLGINLETGENYLIQEKLAFYWSLQAAVDHLVLVFKSQGENGKPLDQSVFLKEIIQWFPQLAEERHYYPLGPTLCNSFESCSSHLERKELWVHYLSQPNSEIPPEEQEICNQLLSEPEFLDLALRLNHWNWGRAKVRFFEADSPANKWLLSRFGERSVINITAIEDYRSCPYRFFLKYVLQVIPVSEPPASPEALDLGELYHAILRDFHLNFIGIGLVVNNFDQYWEMLRNLLEKHFDVWHERVANDIARVILDLQKAEISKNLIDWLRAELDWTSTTGFRFKPQLLEYDFGSRLSSVPTTAPYRFQWEGINALISGRIDRVDVDQERNFIVYDYKLGESLTAKELVEVAKIQIPVYILALEQLIFGADKAVGGCYLSLNNSSRAKGGIWQQAKIEPVIKSKAVLTPFEWKEWLQQICQEVARAIKGIREGNYKTVISCLPYCEYQSCCRRQELFHAVAEVNEPNAVCAE